MRFEDFEDFDRVAWDAFVSAHPNGHYMQSYAWGTFQRMRGWRVRYCVLRENASIRAAALVLSRRVPGVGTVLYSPRGPVVDVRDHEAMEALFAGLKDLVGRRGVFLRCDPYWLECDVDLDTPIGLGLQSIERDWSYWNAPRFVVWLDLDGSEEEVLMRMASKARSRVRKGYRGGVDFSIAAEREIDDFHSLMVATSERKGIAFRDAEYYRQLLSVVGESVNVKLFLGRLDGQVLTGGISAVYGDKAWGLYSVSAPEAQKLRVNRTQQWEMIRWAHALGCHRFDFRGAATNDPPSEDDPGYGVYVFKMSFGSEFVRLAEYYDLVSRPLAYRLLRLVEERGLPVAYRMKTLVQR